MGSQWCAEMLSRTRESVVAQAIRHSIQVWRPDCSTLSGIKEACVLDTEEDGCWLWTGCVSTHGTPIVRSGNNQENLRLTVWRLAHPCQEQFANSVIRPRCGHPRCLNPEHLVQQSWSAINKKSATKINQFLRGRKNLSARLRNGTTKLNWEKAEAIRASDEHVSVLATRYGVCEEYIRLVRNGERWKRPFVAGTLEELLCI